MGGVKVDGSTITIDENGVISSSGGGGSYSSSVNVVNKKITVLKSLSIAGGGSRTEIEDLRMTIVPNNSDSKFEINYSIVYDFTTYNAGFVVQGRENRNIITPGGNDGVNDMTFVNIFETNYTSTAQTACYSMIDEPGTTNTVVYKITVKVRTLVLLH